MNYVRTFAAENHRQNIISTVRTFAAENHRQNIISTVRTWRAMSGEHARLRRQHSPPRRQLEAPQTWHAMSLHNHLKITPSLFTITFHLLEPSSKLRRCVGVLMRWNINRLIAKLGDDDEAIMYYAEQTIDKKWNKDLMMNALNMGLNK